jgi:PAS domain S-box-containing protein
VRITRFHGEGPTRVVVAHENITERMMAEIQLADYTAHLEELVEERTAQLQRLNKRLTTVLNNVSTPVLLVDADGKIQIANPSFNNKFGYSPDELVGRSLWSIFDTTHHPVLFNLMHTAQNSGTSKAAQIQIAGKNGACIDAEISLSSVPDNDSQVVCTLYDISHLKEVERVKDEFISMVTHELRTPVTSIVLSLSMMDIYYDRLTDEQKRSKLDNVCNQANTLAELVKSILDVSRFADRRGKRRDDPVDVGKTLREVAVELNEQVAAKRQQLHLDIFNDAVDDALNGASNDSANSRLTIRGEAIDIMRVWRNLLTNAIKYTEEGGSITARALAADRLPDLTAFGDSIPVDLCSGDYIIGLVEDNGHGIRSEDMPHLFSRFYRGWAAGTNITGTGLGLSLVRDVLRYYGGDIAVSSTLGVGTTFCFWLLADRTL